MLDGWRLSTEYIFDNNFEDLLCNREVKGTHFGGAK